MTRGNQWCGPLGLVRLFCGCSSTHPSFKSWGLLPASPGTLTWENRFKSWGLSPASSGTPTWESCRKSWGLSPASPGTLTWESCFQEPSPASPGSESWREKVTMWHGIPTAEAEHDAPLVKLEQAENTPLFIYSIGLMHAPHYIRAHC